MQKPSVFQTPISFVKCFQLSRSKSTIKTSYSRRYVTKLFQNFGKLQPAKTTFACKSQKLMLYNEIVENSHQGCYFMLPLGLRALEKLIRVIDEEMQEIGSQKISMPTLAPHELWHKSGRWDTTMSELFKLKDRHGQQYCLGPTHEELVTKLMASLSPISYRKLPLRLYQITRKFRDEKNPKYLLLRGREFEMKDMYTFDVSEEMAIKTYHSVCAVYRNILNKLKLPFIEVEGDTGNIGGRLSHEFHLPAAIGEGKLLICDKCSFRSNKELVKNINEACPTCDNDCKLRETPGIEIGHTFLLETKYSSIFKSTFYDSNSDVKLTQMGCYGIGVTRLLQGAIEMLSTDKQIRWPQIIAPYQICIIPQKSGYMADDYFKMAESVNDELNLLPNLNKEIVIDDRIELTVGKRLYEAKRIGYPYIIIVSKQSLESPPLFEFIETQSQQPKFLSLANLKDTLSSIETI